MELNVFIALLIGVAIFFVWETVLSRRHANAEDKVLKGYFLLGLSGLMAKIAIADGRVTVDEAELANKIFDSMELTQAEKAICIGNFITARREGLDARDHAKRFLAYANKVACEFLYDLLWRISSADGVLDPAEDALLKNIAVYLGLDEKLYLQLKAVEHPTYNREHLRQAGIPATLIALA